MATIHFNRYIFTNNVNNLIDYTLQALEFTHSYAMENAHEDLKKVARFRAKKNNENGVVEKIREVLNI